jgi:hypothetical protein
MATPQAARGLQAPVPLMAFFRMVTLPGRRRLPLIVIGLLLAVAPLVARAPSVRAADQQLGRLAFVRDGDVWVADVPDGAPRQLTQTGDLVEPRWSASGTWLSARRLHTDDHTSELVTIEVATGQLINLHEHVTGDIVWAPSVDRVAYLSDDGAVVSDPDGSDRVEFPGATSTVWSNDSAQMAYFRSESSGAGLYVVDSSGSNERLIQPADPDGTRLLLAGWSTDDTHVLGWLHPLGSASLAMDGLPLKAYPIDGSTPTMLSEAVLPHRDFVDLGPASTGRVAASVGAGRATWARKAIAVGDPDGRLRSISPEDRADLYPAWSPDGSWLAMTSGPAALDSAGGDTAQQALAERRTWLMRPDGSARHALLPGSSGRDERPKWSADGHMLLWVRVPAESAPQVWLGPVAGTEPPRLLADGLGGPGARDAGVFGYMDWSRLYAWWQPRPPKSSAVDEASTALAASAVQAYYAAIDDGDYVTAYALWDAQGKASGQTLAEFAAGFTDTADVDALVGPPGALGAAAGSRYVDVPVDVYARTTSGVAQHFQGTLTLRRSVVDGAADYERRWHIYSADIHRLPDT